jgi:APA family basic amino acid/polyamine antiporter
MSTTSTPSPQGDIGLHLGQDRLFVRKATGLVRELSLRDTLFLNLAYVCFPLGFFYLTVLGGLFPGVNIGVAWLITAVVVIPHLVTYGLFSAAMPRSGGDYLFIGRSIHPFWGFVMNATYIAFQITSAAWIATFVPLFALPALFQGIAITTGNTGWADIATTVSGQNAEFAIASGMVILFGALAMIHLRVLIRIFTVLISLTFLGVLFTIGALLLIEPGQFQDNFARFGSTNRVTSDAVAAGFTPRSVSFVAALAAPALLFGATGVAHIATYFAGEVRRPARNMLRAILGAMIIGTLGFTLVSFLTLRSFGREFIDAAGYLAAVKPEQWPLQGAPFINLFIGIGEPHTWLVVLLGVAFVAGVMVTFVPTFLLGTRSLFAYAFDRVLPMRVADVNDRTHTPIPATLITVALMLGFLAGFVYSSARFSTYLLVAGVSSYLLFASVGVAAMLFPYRRREMYEASPVRRSIFGVPMIAVFGFFEAAIAVTYLVVLFANEQLGARNTQGLTVLGYVVAVVAAIWVIAWLRSRRSGLDLALTQQVLPPE